MNQAACDLAKGVALEGGAIFAGSICQTAGAYASGAGKEAVQKQFQDQIAIFLKNDVELLIAEVSEFSWWINGWLYILGGCIGLSRLD